MQNIGAYFFLFVKQKKIFLQLVLQAILYNTNQVWEIADYLKISCKM
jgi:hypothetical protein